MSDGKGAGHGNLGLLKHLRYCSRSLLLLGPAQLCRSWIIRVITLVNTWTDLWCLCFLGTCYKEN